MTARRIYAVALIGGSVIGAIGLFVGAWWIVFLIGLAVGLVLRPARGALILGALLGLSVYAEPLLRDQFIYGLGPTATSLAAIMGFVHQPAIPIILTCVLGLLLGLAGAWLGSASRALFQPAISR
jgi:hypothetical protein